MIGVLHFLARQPVVLAGMLLGVALLALTFLATATVLTVLTTSVVEPVELIDGELAALAASKDRQP